MILSRLVGVYAFVIAILLQLEQIHVILILSYSYRRNGKPKCSKPRCIGEGGDCNVILATRAPTKSQCSYLKTCVVGVGDVESSRFRLAGDDMIYC